MDRAAKVYQVQIVKNPDGEPQDIKQVWFTGSHADVGGGYEEPISGLSKFPLIWMIEEAIEAKLAIDGNFTIGSLGE